MVDPDRFAEVGQRESEEVAGAAPDVDEPPARSALGEIGEHALDLRLSLGREDALVLVVLGERLLVVDDPVRVQDFPLARRGARGDGGVRQFGGRGRVHRSSSSPPSARWEGVWTGFGQEEAEEARSRRGGVSAASVGLGRPAFGTCCQRKKSARIVLSPPPAATTAQAAHSSP